MKLCKPSYEIWKQSSGLEGIYKQIEKAGRVCYKSEDKITEDSAKPFIDNVLLKRHHHSPLEHGTVYLQIHWNNDNREEFDHIYCDYASNPYSRVTRKVQEDDLCPTLYVTTNYRTLIEHNWLNDLKYLCKPTEYHEKRVTVKFILSRSIAQEYTRHRVFSFAMESQRYCAYNRNKFGNEVTFIKPYWLNIPDGRYTNTAKQSPEDGEYKQIMLHENNINTYPLTTTPEGRFLWNCYLSEHNYFYLINQGWKPQQAREVLPNACKTELIMTGFVSDWKNFFDLRCAPSAHPQARELAIPLEEEFKSLNLI